MVLPSQTTFHLILTTALAKEESKSTDIFSYPDIALEKLYMPKASLQDHVELFNINNMIKELRGSGIQFLLQKMLAPTNIGAWVYTVQ